jgi:hypothetical protein
MKKGVVCLLAAVAALASCAALRETPQERREREAREAQMVLDNIQAGDFTIDITRMYPLRGTAHNVTGHSVTVRDGVLYSALPFFGQAWRVPYGGGHALNFEAPVRDYSVANHPKGGYVVNLYVKTDEDEHVYQFRIYENGSSTLDVQSRNRDRISFSGEMIFGADDGR